MHFNLKIFICTFVKIRFTVMVTDGLFLYDCEMSVEHEKHFIVRRMTVKFGHSIKGRRVTTTGSKGRNSGELISFNSTRARE